MDTIAVDDRTAAIVGRDFCVPWSFVNAGDCSSRSARFVISRNRVPIARR